MFMSWTLRIFTFSYFFSSTSCPRFICSLPKCIDWTHYKCHVSLPLFNTVSSSCDVHPHFLTLRQASNASRYILNAFVRVGERPLCTYYMTETMPDFLIPHDIESTEQFCEIDRQHHLYFADDVTGTLQKKKKNLVIVLSHYLKMTKLNFYLSQFYVLCFNRLI